MVMRHSCYANGFQFGSHLADFNFFNTFFQAYVLPLQVTQLLLG